MDRKFRNNFEICELNLKSIAFYRTTSALTSAKNIAEPSEIAEKIDKINSRKKFLLDLFS